MRKHYVYELINLMGTVEYVGETYRPKIRMYGHTKVKPSITNKNREGKFYGRQDLVMYIVAEFNNRKDALELEGKLKLSYGLRWGEKERKTKSVSVYTKDNKIIATYKSALEASKELKLNNSHVSKVLQGKLKTTNGYIIRYKQ